MRSNLNKLSLQLLLQLPGPHHAKLAKHGPRKNGHGAPGCQSCGFWWAGPILVRLQTVAVIKDLHNLSFDKGLFKLDTSKGNNADPPFQCMPFFMITVLRDFHVTYPTRVVWSWLFKHWFGHLLLVMIKYTRRFVLPLSHSWVKLREKTAANLSLTVENDQYVQPNSNCFSNAFLEI